MIPRANTLTRGYDSARADQKTLNRISRNLNFKFLITSSPVIYAYGTIQKSVGYHRYPPQR